MMHPDTFADQNIIRKMRRNIRLRFLLTFALWFGAVCGISALICMTQYIWNNIAEVFAACTLIGFAVLICILWFLTTRMEKNIGEMPELLPPDSAVGTAWAQSDAYYTQEIYKLNRERKSLITLGILLGPFLVILFILSEVNYQTQIRNLGLHPGSPATALKEYARKQQSSWCWCGFMLLLFSGFMILFSAMLGFVAHSKTTVLNSCARSVYNAAMNYQTDLDTAGEKWQLETMILNIDDARADNPVHQEIYRYFMDIERYNYAVICDAEGKVNGALVSRRPITEYDVSHPQTFDEQYNYMKSLFHSDEAVGNYICGQYPK